ncbi:MAG: HEAT repeat domain-containing protein [Planctomycetes bacterium]|nr:HEAT repeat domain-containing protein [Planctomycetota bacterium]
MSHRTLVSFASLAAVAAAQTPLLDRAAAIRHYAAVEAELRAAVAPGDPAIASRRREVIDLLQEYRERADFGRRRSEDGERVPLFVDAAGRRCAVAWLLDHTGAADLTLDIAQQHNRAFVVELAGDERLTAWLAAHGLSPEEAARIQYPPNGLPVRESAPPPEPVRRPSSSEGDAAPRTPTVASTPGQAAETPPPASGPTMPGAGGGRARGLPLDALQPSPWITWWSWNRGAFELPFADEESAADANDREAARLRDAAHARLVAMARSTHATIRAAAVQALGRTGAPVAELTPHLTDASRDVSLAAMLALANAGGPPHVHALLSFLRQNDRGEDLAVAVAGMATVGEGPTQRLLADTVIRLLTDERANAGTAAALAASAWADERMRIAARDALRNGTSPAQRAAGAEALGVDADAADVAALTAAAHDGSVAVRRAAALALGRSKHRLALPALQTASEAEREPDTRAQQLFAIGDHGGAAAKDFLLAHFEEGSKQLRGSAALALGLFGRSHDEPVRTELAARIAAALAAERNQDQKGAYVLALGLLRDRGSRDFLIATLQSSASATRGAAASALGMLQDRAALAPLRRVLVDDACPWVRQQAARALGRLDNDAIDALVEAMRVDADAVTRRTAAFALGGLGAARAAEALLDLAAEDQAPAEARAGAALGLGRHFRRGEPKLPTLRFQHDPSGLPAIAAWAFLQEL